MKNMAYPPHLIHLLAELYRQQKAKAEVTGTVSESFHIKKEVRHECVMSSYLFNIMAEMAMRETLDDFTGGIQIGGQEITNLRYADDIVLMTQSEDKLQELVTRLDIVCRNKYDLHINMDKTKVMATDGTSCCIKIQNRQLEQVKTFSYLGTVIAEDATSKEEIRSRLRTAWGISTSLNKLRENHNLSVHTKICLLKSLIWPIATYGYESWTIKKEDEDRIKAFEMKRFRHILRIPWTAKRTNEWVLETSNVNRSLLESIIGLMQKYPPIFFLFYVSSFY